MPASGTKWPITREHWVATSSHEVTKFLEAQMNGDVIFR